ncbi:MULTISPECIES: ABC transporter permease [Brevibacterium]|jgi:ABC-2 type transport system permease protein|uniref:Sodium ABC transporter permease n=1 Tax=Brevibacterium casei TaxID=33889 RepID=A0A7T4A043_9MICO|nr:sodium ABC transporter permease [Brevibacterium casei]QQB14803.1 sodium ABC transporter permease [Brevibacterium casei]
MARKDDARDEQTPDDDATKTTTSKGTAPTSLDDLGGVTGDVSAAGKSGAGKASAAKAGAGKAAGGKTAAGKAGAGKAASADADDRLGEDSADSTLGLDEVPYELAEDTPDPEDLPETGLVSEFVDVGKRQASWLVSNRESSTTMRSPFFLVTVAVVVLGIVAVIVSGIVRDAQANSGTPSMAMVGVGEQAAMYEQQLGVSITDAPDAQAAEQLVRDGTVDAAFIQDPSGQSQPTIIALDKQPTALLERLAPQTEATLLQTPAVPEDVAVPLLWGMVVFSLLVIATLGTALYQNLRLEKRNRITEIIAATIPPRAAASGRVTGMLTLVVIHLLVAAVVLELGLSISGQTSLAFAMLPGLGWFALTLFFTAWTIFALLVWASTITGDKARKTMVAIIGVLTVGGAMAPVIVGASGTVGRVLGWAPFTSPIGIADRYFAAQPEWWEGLVAAAIAAVLAFIIHALAGGAYVRSVLAGGGRGGKTVKMSKRAKKVAAAKDADAKGTDSKDADAKDSNSKTSGAEGSDAKDADDSDADASDEVTVEESETVITSAKGTASAKSATASKGTTSAKGTKATGAGNPAKDADSDDAK